MGCLNVDIETIRGTVSVAPVALTDDVVTSLTRQGCMSVSLSHCGSVVEISLTKTGSLETGLSYAPASISVTAGLVCEVNKGKWEYLVCEDGPLLTLDNEFIYLPR